MKEYINKWFDFKIGDDLIVRAQVIDVEFETGFGPIFLMKTKQGDLFLATLKEIKKYAV